MLRALSFSLLLLTAWTVQAVAEENLQVVFEDAFDGKLAEGWKWTNEDAKSWRVKDNALEICARPVNNDGFINRLSRPVPKRNADTGVLVVETVLTNLTKPTKLFEQAGIYVTVNGKVKFKFVKELVRDGKIVCVPGFKPITTDKVKLRVEFRGKRLVASFQPNCEGEFIVAAERDNYNYQQNEEVGIQVWHGYSDQEHWMKFDYFKMSAPAK